MRTLWSFRAIAVAAFALVLTAAGCTTSHTTVDPVLTPAGQDRAAQEALNRWEALLATRGTDSPFLLVTDPTTVFGDLSGADAAGFKQALLAGRVEAAIHLPTAAPPDTTLRWPGGGTTTLAMVSAADALKALQTPTSQPCPGCAQPTQLKVGSASLGVAHLASSRGPVDVPTWVFTIEDHNEKIARLAVRQDTPLFVSLGSGPYRGDYQPTATASIAADDRTLTVTDSATSGAGRCNDVLTGHVFESAHAVSFTAIATPGTPATSACQPNAGAVTVMLGEPLGTRLVLDSGLPIAVARSTG